MTRHEHLMMHVMEECAEVQQRISKAMRFGMEQVQKAADDRPEQNPQEWDNAERIWREYVDLIALMEMLGFNAEDAPQVQIAQKKEKVEKYLLLAKREGTLQET